MPSFFSSYQPRPPHTPAESSQHLSSQQSQLRIASLIEELTKPDIQERRGAALALGQIGPDARDAVPALITALKDSELNVRDQAALALGAIGPDAGDAVPALTALISDPNFDVRESAATAIKKITSSKVAEQQIATEKHSDTAHQPAPSEPTVGRDVPPITHAELDRQARAIAVTTLGITWGSTVAGFAIGASFSPGAGGVGLVLGSFTGIAAAVAYLRKAS